MAAEADLARVLSPQFLYETAPIGLAFLSPDCRYLSINRHLTEICGISVEGHLGRQVRECVPTLGDAVEAIVQSILETGRPVTGVEVAGQNPADTVQRTWLTYWHPVRGVDDEIIGINVAAKEITERKQAEVALQASEQQFRTLADSIPQLVWMSDAYGAITWWNRQLCEFSPLPPETIRGQDWLTVLCPDDGAQQWVRAMVTGERLEMELNLCGGGGHRRPFLTRIVPLRSADGIINRWLGTHIDISDIRQREEHIRFIADELSHRSKNLLAVVIAIAQQTVGQVGQAGDYYAYLAARLTALARCNDLLTRDNWSGTPLHDLVARQLEPFGGTEGGRCDVSGPQLTLNATAVQHLGMALHELATNASKYGALSGESGRVSIHWMVDAAGRMISLRWQESGGPVVKAPQREGFGSAVIEQIVPRALKGRGSLAYPPEGVCWTFDFPA